MKERKQSGRECRVRFNALVTKGGDNEVHWLTHRNVAKSLNLSLTFSLFFSPWHVRHWWRWRDVQVQDGWFLLPAGRASAAVRWLSFTGRRGALEDMIQLSRDEFITFVPQTNKQTKPILVKGRLTVHSMSIILRLQLLQISWNYLSWKFFFKHFLLHSFLKSYAAY